MGPGGAPVQGFGLLGTGMALLAPHSLLQGMLEGGAGQGWGSFQQDLLLPLPVLPDGNVGSSSWIQRPELRDWAVDVPRVLQTRLWCCDCSQSLWLRPGPAEIGFPSSFCSCTAQDNSILSQMGLWPCWELGESWAVLG